MRPLRPLLSRLLRPLSPAHRERDRLVASVASMLAEDPVIRVPDFGGSFQVDPRSRLFYRLIVDGGYEPELASLVHQHIDLRRDAIDIGANIGFFTCLLCKLLPGRRVLSVEPTPGALKNLQANIERNGFKSQVVIFEGVATDKPGLVELAYVSGKEEFSSIGAITHPSADTTCVQKLNVAGETLDTLVAKFDLNPGFIKVDTEGAESLVFSGATSVLKGFRPVVLSELSDPLLKAKGSSAAEVIHLFEKLDYVVTDPLSPSSRPGSRPYGDLLAVPKQ